MSKVSVIIPVYNVEMDLEACLRSVMHQTYANLEILVCDDGSTDDSGAICDRIAAEDTRIHIIHKVNGGLSSARNACLDQATGDYVTFVDSDDVIAGDYIEQLIHACEQQDAQIAICDYQRISEKAMSLGDVNSKGMAVYTNIECLEHMYHPKSSGMSFVAWAKLFRRTLFEELQIRYPVGKIHEDQFTTYRLLYAANRIAYVQMPLYGYRTRDDSIMHRSYRLERTVIVEATRGQCDLFLKCGEKGLSALAVNNHIRTLFSVLANLREMHTAEGDQLAKCIEQEIRADVDRYLPQVELSTFKKVVYQLAAAMPIQPLVQKLRMF